MKRSSRTSRRVMKGRFFNLKLSILQPHYFTQTCLLREDEEKLILILPLQFRSKSNKRSKEIACVCEEHNIDGKRSKSYQTTVS